MGVTENERNNRIFTCNCSSGKTAFLITYYLKTRKIYAFKSSATFCPLYLFWGQFWTYFVIFICVIRADKNIPTNKGEVAAQLTSEGVIKVRDPVYLLSTHLANFYLVSLKQGCGSGSASVWKAGSRSRSALKLKFRSSKWSRGGPWTLTMEARRIKMEPWRACRPVVAGWWGAGFGSALKCKAGSGSALKWKAGFGSATKVMQIRIPALNNFLSWKPQALVTVLWP